MIIVHIKPYRFWSEFRLGWVKGMMYNWEGINSSVIVSQMGIVM